MALENLIRKTCDPRTVPYKVRNRYPGKQTTRVEVNKGPFCGCAKRKYSHITDTAQIVNEVRTIVRDFPRLLTSVLTIVAAPSCAADMPGLYERLHSR